MAEYVIAPTIDFLSFVDPAARVVVDLRCGDGSLGAAIREKRNAEVWGVEENPKRAAIAESRLDRVVRANFETALRELPDDYFDVVIAPGALSAWTEPEEALLQLQSKLTADGALLLDAPNVRSWRAVRGLLEGNWNPPRSVEGTIPLRHYTGADIAATLNESGYEIEKMWALGASEDAAPQELLQIFERLGYDAWTLAEESRYDHYVVRAVRANSLTDAEARTLGAVRAAHRLLLQGDFDGALERFERISELTKPGESGAMESTPLLAGRLALLLGKHEAAVRYFRAARNAAPDEAEPTLGLIEALAAAGMNDEAAELAARELERRPDDEELKRRLGELE
ncbi:MAG: methyltransferase domain-containing protein [Ignavibacteriales bacterium]|nr:methyltransferase domain-containing protein [Ignavibacteriales bacterium]